MEDTYDIFLQKRHDLITKNVQELLSSKYNSLSKIDINKLVDKKIDELKKNKSWHIKEFFKSNYIASKDVNAWLCLAEVTK